MSTAIVGTNGQTQSEAEFQAKMQERMRQAMGDLMPDEVLSGIVAKGIENAFFKSYTRSNPNNYRTEEHFPGWLEEFMLKEAKEQVEKQVKAWIAENAYKFVAMAEKVLQQGIARNVVAVFDDLLTNQTMNIRNSVAEAIGRLRTGG